MRGVVRGRHDLLPLVTRANVTSVSSAGLVIVEGIRTLPPSTAIPCPTHLPDIHLPERRATAARRCSSGLASWQGDLCSVRKSDGQV
jgi:hypothetical protein